ncbi:MAG: hypothetical protein JWQ72_186 [Polaromonas sp.]|nr:hypothetical protein [Polaromonas sp.]
MTAPGDPVNSSDDELMRRIRNDLIDSYDEELEMELEDRTLAELTGEEPEGRHSGDKEARRQYFRELFRLQGELVKLQDWVVSTGHKVVILFEGRDAAGKGGVIKRITQRLNPRICRVAALPAPNDRERTQWYFQRYVSHLPAAGEIVLFNRSWYNRAGVERVMGFCTDEQYEEFFRTVPDFEKMLVSSGIQLIKYWFSFPTRSSTCASSAASTTRSSSGSSAPWTWSRAAAGKTTRVPRKSCWSAPTSRKPPGGWSRPSTRRRRA